MKRYFPLTILLLLSAVIALAAPGDKRPAVTSAAIGLGTSSSPTLASITATTSVTAPAFNSTAADGYHYVLPYNSVAFAGTPSVGMFVTTPTGPQWYTGSAWEAIGSGGGGTWGSITGTLSAQTDLQAALDAISAGGITMSVGIPTDPGAAYLNDTTHVLTVASTTGYTQFTGSFTAWDTTPDAFAFTDETDVAADGGLSCGAAITVSNINYPTTISATGDTGYGYKINGGTFTSASGTVALNDTVAPCVNRSTINSTATTATVTIGGVSDTYSVTTAAGTCNGNTMLSIGSGGGTYLLSEIYGSNTLGQSFTPTSSGYMYSVVLTLAQVNNADISITIRTGDSLDLTTNYTEQTFVGPFSNGDHEFVFTTQPVLTSGTQKYIAIKNSSSNYSDYFTIVNENNTAPYSGGTALNSASGWSMSTDSSRDSIMVVKTCP